MTELIDNDAGSGTRRCLAKGTTGWKGVVNAESISCGR